MPQPILIPLDGSPEAEQALPYAEALAEPGCQLILLEVAQDPDDEFSLLDRHAGSCARLETASGDPAEQILRTARDLDVGAIVMTTHGRGALGRWTFGSVADAVTRRSSIPVMVIRPDGAPEPAMRRLVVPLDGSPLAERALPVAQSLARRLGIPVHLVTAIDPASLVPSAIAPALAFDAEVYDETLSLMRGAAEAGLTQASEMLREAGVDASWEILCGSPYVAIADAFRPGDVAVMTSHGRSGIARVVMGSVAEKLIREGPVPVMLVPSGQDNERPAVAGRVDPAQPVVA